MGHILLVYIDDISGTVQGYIHAQVYESLYSDTGLNILGLAVLPSHQGQGIGASLLKAVEQIAQKEGYHFIRLNSAESRLKPIFSTKRMAITPIKCRSILSSTLAQYKGVPYMIFDKVNYKEFDKEVWEVSKLKKNANKIISN